VRSTEVTLITGDRIRIMTGADGRQTAIVDHRYARPGVTYDERTIPGPGHSTDLLVIPSDAADLISSGELDENRRSISELLPEDVAAAAVEFITGPLLEAPYRVGKPLRDKLVGFHSARLGTQWRVLYRIDEAKRVVVVQDIQHRSDSYRRR
jgi:mRNA interferase RelE/StbE